jgi:hypothetical protein
MVTTTAIVSMTGERAPCGCSVYEPVVRRRKGLTVRNRRRLLREARGMLADHGIDWSRYGEPRILGYDDCPHQDGLVLTVRWPLWGAPDGSAIVLSEIWWDNTTGAILQAGTQGGDLVY